MTDDKELLPELPLEPTPPKPKRPKEVLRIEAALKKGLKLKGDRRVVRTMFKRTMGYPKGLKVGGTVVGKGVRLDLRDKDMRIIHFYAKNG